jgi:tyrosinase
MKTKQAVAIPTWYDDISELFTPGDIGCMKGRGFDLSDYETVKNGSGSIYGQVSGGMMPKGGPAWSVEKVTTFSNWMNTGFTKGPRAGENLNLKALGATVSVAARIRKEVSTLSAEEVTTLQKAFSGIMAKGVTDLSSFYKIAGWHGFPHPNCMHHTPGYNPWHRIFLWNFENALRTVEGCENVTLPYWDFSQEELPAIFNTAPLDSYTLPIDTTFNGTTYKKGMTTARYLAEEIQANMAERGTIGFFDNAANEPDWEDYHGMLNGSMNDTTFAGHDSGHMSIGLTMANQDISSFDPIFWFYHCNLDRLYWEWQTKMTATTKESILKTINSEASRNIFTIPAFEALPPFEETSPFSVDSENSLDVDYEVLAKKTALKMNLKTKGKSSAKEEFSINTEMANVRIKGFNRLKIPGSFDVILKKDGVSIAKRGFFQPNEVEKCPNCVDNAIVHFDFKLPISELSNGTLSISVEPISTPGEEFPLNKLGDPTINVRLLLQNK